MSNSKIRLTRFMISTPNINLPREIVIKSLNGSIV